MKSSMLDSGSVSVISARLDRLPSSGPLWSWIVRISFGAFFEIYETALTSLLAPLLVHAGIFHKDRGGLLGLPDLPTFAFSPFFCLFVRPPLFSAIPGNLGRPPLFAFSLFFSAPA